MTPIALLLMLAARPDTPGTQELFAFEPGDVVETYDTSRFRIHYTRAGKNAVPSADIDASGVPDHVEQIGTIYESVIDTYTGLGFRPPVDDGDGLFDVYLIDTDLTADGAFEGESCTGHICSGFMVQENDFAGFGYPSVTFANRLLASHELFHAVQAAYNNGEGAVISEGTAVWASEHFDAALFDLEGFSQDYLENTDRALSSDGVSPSDNFTYGTAVFWEYLSQRFGVDVIRQIWEACDDPAEPAWPSVIDGVLASNGATGFADVFVDFALATLSLGDRADPAKGFTDANALFTLPLKATALPLSNRSFLLFPSSYVTFGLAPGDRTEVRVAVAGTGANTEDLRLALVPLSSTSAGTPVTGGLDLSLAPGGSASIAVQIVNTSLGDTSARPSLCMGSSDEVDACLAAFADSPDTPPPDDGNKPPPGGCGASGPSAGMGMLALALMARRRRR